MKNVFIILIAFLIFGCTESNDEVDDSIILESDYPIKKSIGYSANDILSSENFSEIIFEIMYVDGYKPTNEAIDKLKKFVETRTNKTTINIETKLISIDTKSSYTIDDVKSIEDANRSILTSDNQISISGLFLNGASSKNTSSSMVLGTAYRNTSFVIFEETLHSLSDSTFEPSRYIIESSVILHELCHLLGLVNLGTNMVENHEDIDHSAHCTSEDCLMYYALEDGNSLPNFIFEGNIPELDMFCISDLKANGGK